MKRILAAILALLLTMACAAMAESMSEEEAWEAAQAGTLVSDPKTGYEYSEDTETWYYSNYPNYKDFMADGKIKVAFVCKFSGVWFTPKQEALAEVCKEHGYEYLFVDANGDEQAWLDGLQNVINQDFDVVVLCPVNTALLPDAVDMLQEAGIAYMTTDDPGADVYGFYPPHSGLNSYGLHHGLGEHVAKKMQKSNWMDGVKDDYSNFLFVIQDSPSVETIHERNRGFYEAIKEAYPDIPEDRVLWLDCGASMPDDVLAKFPAVLQANVSSVEKWIISGGAASVVPTVTLFKEAGVSMENVIIADCFSYAEQLEISLKDEEVRNSCYGVVLVSKPSGTLVGNLIADLVENGTPLPAFVGYDLIISDKDTVEDLYNEYFK